MKGINFFECDDYEWKELGCSFGYLSLITSAYLMI